MSIKKLISHFHYERGWYTETMRFVSNIEDALHLDKYLQRRRVMIDRADFQAFEGRVMINKADFQAFEERFEQLAAAIVETLLAASILRFVFFLAELP